MKRTSCVDLEYMKIPQNLGLLFHLSDLSGDFFFVTDKHRPYHVAFFWKPRFSMNTVSTSIALTLMYTLRPTGLSVAADL